MELDLIQAIAVKLTEIFGEEASIYVGDAVQDGSKPYFLIALLTAQRARMPGNRLSQTAGVSVHYFPGEGERYGALIAIGNALLDALEIITLEYGGVVRGTNQRYEIADGVLCGLTEYQMHLNVPAEKAVMESLSMETGTGEMRKTARYRADSATNTYVERNGE